MIAATLAAIRAEATTEQDALECVNAILCNFKPNAGAGDALLTCAMDIEALVIYGPEQGADRDDSWMRRQDVAVEEYAERAFNARMSLSRMARM